VFYLKKGAILKPPMWSTHLSHQDYCWPSPIW